MDERRAAELLATERARLERLLRAEIAATAPDQGDEVDDANWRIAEETGRAVSRSLRDRWSALQRAEERLQRGTYGLSISSGKPIPDERLEADPLAELLVEEAAVEAFRARHASDSMSGLSSSTRRTLAALVDRDESGDESGRTAASSASRRPAEAIDQGDEAAEEAAEEVDESAEDLDESAEDLDVDDLEDEELIDEDEVAAASADFDDEDEQQPEEDDEPEAVAESEDDEAEPEAEPEEERRPRRRRSGRR